MKKVKFIENIKVKSPCSEEWEDMSGNEKIRFCSHCAKDVNNISEMTRKEAMRLIRKYEGRLCIRYHIDQTTQRPIFIDTLHKLTRRAPAMTAGVMATSFAVATAAYAQGEPVPVPRDTTQVVLKTDGDTSILSGYVTDPKGAAIPYAVVSLINQKTYDYRSISASFEGFYEFKDVQPGEYTLKFEGGGFEAREMRDIAVSNGGELRRDASLALPSVNEVVTVGEKLEVRESGLMGVISCVELLVPSNPLVTAVMNDDLEEVKARVMMRARVNARDKSHDGITPIHAAVENANIEIIQFLLDSGAKVNIRDSLKRTPLMMMDGDATPEIFDLLIRYGAKLQLLDKEKNTVLHHIVGNSDNPDLVRLLINHGIDVNAVNKSRETALMIAAENGNAESVKVLLESGADVTKLSAEDKTAWDLADDSNIKQLLESYGAVAKTEQ